MPRRPKLSARLRAAVRRRAGYLCEYCHALEAWQYVEFTMEHLVPVAEGGGSTPDNLAFGALTCHQNDIDARRGLWLLTPGFLS